MTTQATLYIELIVNIQIIPFVLFFFFHNRSLMQQWRPSGSGGRGDSVGNTDSECRVVSVGRP